MPALVLYDSDDVERRPRFLRLYEVESARGGKNDESEGHHDLVIMPRPVIAL
jgi:hypothetical protein